VLQNVAGAYAISYNDNQQAALKAVKGLYTTIYLEVAINLVGISILTYGVC